MRTVWQAEQSQFTPWLAENIALLNEAVGLEIEIIQREMPAGDFRVDLFGKDVGSGHEVIIENQLAPTDHGHLGQLVAYAAGLEAKIVIWISPQFREEHRQAIDWLNLHTTEGLSFFAVELELLQINDSLPAPHFKVLAQPNDWKSTVAPGPSGRSIGYHDFFSDLLGRIKARDPGFTTSRRVGYDSWAAFGAGKTGFSFNQAFAAGNRFRVELYIDTGDSNRTKRAFDLLYQQRDDIERLLEERLVWERLDQRRACRISVVQEGVSIDAPSETLDEMKEWAVGELFNLRRVFGSRIKALDISAVPEEIGMGIVEQVALQDS